MEEEQQVFSKPTGVILLVILLIFAAAGDFYYGGSMLFGILPTPAVYSSIGIFYSISLVIGGLFSLLLFYGMWNLKSWARLTLQIVFPGQVIFNVIIDPTNYDNYFLLVISIITAIYLQLPKTREHFN